MIETVFKWAVTATGVIACACFTVIMVQLTFEHLIPWWPDHWWPFSIDPPTPDDDDYDEPEVDDDEAHPA